MSGAPLRGPWANGIAAADLDRSEVTANDLDGAAFFGLRMASGAVFRPVSMTGNSLRNNRITRSASAGMFVHSACANTFAGDNLTRNVSNVGAIFDEATGANTFLGNQTVVIDNGDFDCDGDGVVDPNGITGPGLVRRGVALGPPEASAVGAANGKALR
ncbi:MAG: hypothetical protein WD773_11600 [Gemmatimonadales bacterium]